MKAFDLKAAQRGAKVVTRDGQAVRILAYDRKSPNHPLVGLITRVGDEGVDTFKVDGKYYDNGDSRCDLFMAPTKQTGWINIYPKPSQAMYRYRTERNAKEDSNSSVISTIKIEWEE